MKASLRALLEGTIDYAGMFPPASLGLEQAARNYAAYAQSSEAWLLGRFCLPAAQLDQLRALQLPGLDCLRLTVMASNTATADSFMHELQLDWDQVGRLHCQPESLEARLPDDVLRQPGMASIARLLHAAVAGALAADWPVAGVFLEVALCDPDRGGDFRPALEQSIAALVDYNAAAPSRQCPAGLKLRTGGVRPAAFPAAGCLAHALCACRDGRVYWKATAGLHHPLPHHDSQLGVRMHGFINLHMAAVMAAVHKLDARRVEELLTDANPANFEFADEFLRWRDLKVDTPGVAAARTRSLVSFGSCDFEGPCRELRALGWL